MSIEKTRIINTENQGLAAARNSGISTSTGEFILPLDADDKIGKTYIEKAIQAFKKQTELALVYCRGEYFGYKKGPIEGDGYGGYANLLLYNSIFCSAFFRKEDFLRVGGYNEKMKGGWEDWELWLRLLSIDSKVYQIPEELFFYRIKETSMIQEVKSNPFLMSFLEKKLFQNNLDKYIQAFGDPITVLREYSILKKENQKFEDYKIALHNSMSYRIGNFILSPVKYFNKFKKSSK